MPDMRWIQGEAVDRLAGYLMRFDDARIKSVLLAKHMWARCGCTAVSALAQLAF